MGYVTAGILDSVVHPDAAVESAIVKVCEMQVHVKCVSSANMQNTHLNKCLMLFSVVFVNARYCW